MNPIEATLQAIQDFYPSGLIERVKVFAPGEWKKVKSIEKEINRLSVENDQSGLQIELRRYSKLWKELANDMQKLWKRDGRAGG
jgi:hypothetical protein